MTRVGHLDHHCLDHWNVQGGRHPVVEEAGIQHRALIVVAVFLVQSPADALYGASLDLSLDVAGMHWRSHVQEGGETQYVDLAGLRVYLDVDDVASDYGAHPGGDGGDRGGNGAAGAHQPAGQLPEGKAVIGVFDAGEDAVGEGHVLVLHFPDKRRPGGHLALYVFRCLDGGQTGVEGSAAAAGDCGVADGVGIDHSGDHVFGSDAQHLGGLHRHRGAGAADVDRPGD